MRKGRRPSRRDGGIAVRAGRDGRGSSSPAAGRSGRRPCSARSGRGPGCARGRRRPRCSSTGRPSRKGRSRCSGPGRAPGGTPTTRARRPSAWRQARRRTIRGLRAGRAGRPRRRARWRRSRLPPPRRGEAVPRSREVDDHGAESTTTAPRNGSAIRRQRPKGKRRYSPENSTMALVRPARERTTTRSVPAVWIVGTSSSPNLAGTRYSTRSARTRKSSGSRSCAIRT